MGRWDEGIEKFWRRQMLETATWKQVRGPVGAVVYGIQRFGNWLLKLACTSFRRRRDRGHEGGMPAKCEELVEKSGETGCGKTVGHRASGVVEE